MFEMLSGVLAWYRRKVRDDKRRSLISLKCISFNSKERPAVETTADKNDEAPELQGKEISEGPVREVKEETWVDTGRYRVCESTGIQAMAQGILYEIRFILCVHHAAFVL